MGTSQTFVTGHFILTRRRRKIPEAGITADVIVGFPGKTEREFEDTLKLMEEVKFDNVNTAAYR